MQIPGDPYMQERTIVPCCEHLRTKTMFYMPDEMQAGPGFIKVTSTGVYWCNKTCSSLGPDDEPAVPASCQGGRACHERSAAIAATRETA